MNKDARIYRASDVCLFRKNNGEYGGLSNMATKFPIVVNNIPIKTTEALYQACRFPHNSDLQQKLINEQSPMAVKMISKKYKSQSRDDWDLVKVRIMRWCIQLKMAQNLLTFSEILHSTGSKDIVESSSTDNFWGAIPNEDATLFVGKNALGRLLMELRRKLNSAYWVDLLFVPNIEIEDFNLMDQKIVSIDERVNFVRSLLKYWSTSTIPLPAKDEWVLKITDSKSLSNLGYKFSNQHGFPF